MDPFHPSPARLHGLIGKLAGAPQSETLLVTLSLELTGSRILAAPTRVFLKNHVLKSLSSRHAWFAMIAERIQIFVDSHLRPDSRGLYLVAGPSVWEVVELLVPLPNLFRIDRGPYLAPLLRAVDGAPRVLVARHDPRRSMLQEFHLGTWMEMGHWSPVEVDRDAERIVSGRTTVSAGGTPRARAGIGGGKRDRFEQSVEAETAHMVEALAQRLASLHAGAPTEVVYFFGDPERFRGFRDHLPGDLGERAEFMGPVPRTEAFLRKQVERALESRVQERRAREILEFHERHRQGHLVALGPGDVLAHRTTGKLSRIYVDPEDPVPGLKCESCGGFQANNAGSCLGCEGPMAPVSLTQEIVGHAVRHPPLPMTFVRGPTRWLMDLGGMAALLSPKGLRSKR